MTTSETKTFQPTIIQHVLMLVYLIIGSNIFFMNDITHIAILVVVAINFTIYTMFGYKRWHTHTFNIVMVYLAIRTLEVYIYGI